MTGLHSYFSSLQRVFGAEAAAHGGQIQFNYRIAGHRVRLNFANRTLVPEFTPALSHLPGFCNDTAQLEISIWDDVSTVVPMPAPPWSWENYMSRGEIGGLNTDRFRAWFHVASGILSMLDLANGRAILWVRDPRKLPMYVTAAPLRFILQGWLSQRGLQIAHAAAVGTAAGGVLLAGAGGSGKSTTSLACLNAGMDFVGDDYCLIASEPEPWLHSVYCSAKMDQAMLPNFPGLSPAVQKRNDQPGEKALLLLKDAFAAQLVTDLPMRALLIPTISDQEESSMEPANTLAGIRSLAPSTMQQIAGPDPSAWRMITSLARQLPCFRLKLGRDPTSTPAVISRILEDCA